jgi:hypothetical protein
VANWRGGYGPRSTDHPLSSEISRSGPVYLSAQADFVEERGSYRSAKSAKGCAVVSSALLLPIYDGMYPHVDDATHIYRSLLSCCERVRRSFASR